MLTHIILTWIPSV